VDVEEDEEEVQSNDNDVPQTPLIGLSKKSKKEDAGDLSAVGELNTTGSLKRERKEGKKGQGSDREKRARKDSAALEGSLFGQCKSFGAIPFGKMKLKCHLI
jgi:hypothetical protein